MKMYREATENEIQDSQGTDPIFKLMSARVIKVSDPIGNKEYSIVKTTMEDAIKTWNWEFINRLVQINKYADKITKVLTKKRIRTGYNDFHLTCTNPFTDNNRVEAIIINKIKLVYPKAKIKVEFNHDNEIKVHVELDIKD